MVLKVLLIKGNAHWGRPLAEALRRAGFEVLTASSPRRGLEAVDRASPALVVLNGEMPGCPALCSHLRQLTLTPLVVMGSSPQAEGWERAVEAGADAYLPWGADPTEVLVTFQAVLRRYGVSPESGVGSPGIKGGGGGPQTPDSPLQTLSGGSDEA